MKKLFVLLALLVPFWGHAEETAATGQHHDTAAAAARYTQADLMAAFNAGRDLGRAEGNYLLMAGLSGNAAVAAPPSAVLKRAAPQKQVPATVPPTRAASANHDATVALTNIAPLLDDHIVSALAKHHVRSLVIKTTHTGTAVHRAVVIPMRVTRAAHLWPAKACGDTLLWPRTSACYTRFGDANHWAKDWLAHARRLPANRDMRYPLPDTSDQVLKTLAKDERPAVAPKAVQKTHARPSHTSGHRSVRRTRVAATCRGHLDPTALTTGQRAAFARLAAVSGIKLAEICPSKVYSKRLANGGYAFVVNGKRVNKPASRASWRQIAEAVVPYKLLN